MNKIALAGCVLIGMAIGWAMAFIYKMPKNPTTELDVIINTIDEEQDSLQEQITISDTVIVTIYRNYEKDTSIIINQSVSEDIEFFSNYLSAATE